MKRIFICLFFIIFSTTLLANEPEYSNSLNENINKFAWKVKKSEIIYRSEGVPIEIYTLMDKKYNSYILKCVLIYRGNSISEYCELP